MCFLSHCCTVPVFVLAKLSVTSPQILIIAVFTIIYTGSKYPKTLILSLKTKALVCTMQVDAPHDAAEYIRATMEFASWAFSSHTDRRAAADAANQVSASLAATQRMVVLCDSSLGAGPTPNPSSDPIANGDVLGRSTCDWDSEHPHSTALRIQSQEDAYGISSHFSPSEHSRAECVIGAFAASTENSQRANQPEPDRWESSRVHSYSTGHTYPTPSMEEPTFPRNGGHSDAHTQPYEYSKPMRSDILRRSPSTATTEAVSPVKNFATPMPLPLTARGSACGRELPHRDAQSLSEARSCVDVDVSSFNVADREAIVNEWLQRNSQMLARLH